MSRYTDEELKEMALVVVREENSPGFKSLHLILTVCALTGLTPESVHDAIWELAR